MFDSALLSSHPIIELCKVCFVIRRGFLTNIFIVVTVIHVMSANRCTQHLYCSLASLLWVRAPLICLYVYCRVECSRWALSLLQHGNNNIEHKKTNEHSTACKHGCGPYFILINSLHPRVAAIIHNHVAKVRKLTKDFCLTGHAMCPITCLNPLTYTFFSISGQKTHLFIICFESVSKQELVHK